MVERKGSWAIVIEKWTTGLIESSLLKSALVMAGEYFRAVAVPVVHTVAEAAGEERGQFRRTEVRRNGGQRIRPGLFGAQADTARHPSGLPRVSIGKEEFIRLQWVSRPTLKGRCSYQVLDPAG